MQAKKNITDIPKDFFKGKKVLVRVDFNVPFKNGVISDNTRIKASLPTINYLLDSGAKIILVSHLGRPKGVDESLSLAPVALELARLIDNKAVEFIKDPFSPSGQAIIESLPNSSLCLLENIRFYPQEEKNDMEFANKLASLADIFVNDAFGTSHRAHASTAGVTQKLKYAFAGHLVAKELLALDSCLKNPIRPFAVIIGGSKVSTKISLLDNLVDKVDVLVIGGAMAFTFLKAQGHNVGKSLVENDYLEYCKKLLDNAKTKQVKIVLPSDVMVASDIKQGSQAKCVSVKAIDDNMMGLDVGADTIKEVQNTLSQCKTIFWNGPLGVFEEPGLEKGTYAIIDSLVELTKKGVKTIVGGGDSVAALKAKNIDFALLTHVATGGGATLEYLEGKKLPGIECLNDSQSATPSLV